MPTFSTTLHVVIKKKNKIVDCSGPRHEEVGKLQMWIGIVVNFFFYDLFYCLIYFDLRSFPGECVNFDYDEISFPKW